MKRIPRTIRQSGFILVGTLVTMTFLMAVMLAIAAFGTIHYAGSIRTLHNTSAVNVAEAGVESYLEKLSSGVINCGDSLTNPPVFDNDVQGRSEITVTASGSGDSCEITATGKIFKPSTSSTPVVTRKVRVIARRESTEDTSPPPAVGYSFPNVIHAGPGGLVIDDFGLNRDNGDRSVTGGSSGSIRVAGAADLRSDTIVSVNNFYVHGLSNGASCAAAWGQVCPNGYTSIKINDDYDPWIYANVSKNPNHIIQNSSHITPTTIGNAGADPGFPEGDYRDVIKRQITATGTVKPNTGYTPCQSGSFPEGNVKITGNVTLKGGSADTSGCRIRATGDIWIVGNLNISEYGAIEPFDNNITSRPPTVMVDGTITISGNGKANSKTVGLKLISYYCGTGCSTYDTGPSDLSQGGEGIKVQNDAKVNDSILWARWSKLRVGYGITDNGGIKGALLGQTVDISGVGDDATTVSYGPKLGDNISPKQECNDGVDNLDPEDTLVDLNDPGCTSPDDPSENDSNAGTTWKVKFYQQLPI